MLSPAADLLLSNVEARLEEVARAVAGQDAEGLERACAELRHALQLCAQGLAQLPPAQKKDAALRNRMRRVQALVGAQRGGLARQSARVDMALQAIVPAARSTTYGAGKGPYGGAARQTGAFKLLAA